jgi:hypothetical protein
VQGAVQGTLRGHADYKYRGNRCLSMYSYFFKIGLYPSPINRVRMASASFASG